MGEGAAGTGMMAPRAMAPLLTGLSESPRVFPSTIFSHPKPTGYQEAFVLLYSSRDRQQGVSEARVPSAQTLELGVSMTQLTTHYKAAPTSPEFSPVYGLFLQKTFKQTGLSPAPAPAPLHPKAGDGQPNRISQWTFLEADGSG